jgi:hypothetical protein
MIWYDMMYNCCAFINIYIISIMFLTVVLQIQSSCLYRCAKCSNNRRTQPCSLRGSLWPNIRRDSEVCCRQCNPASRKTVNRCPITEEVLTETNHLKMVGFPMLPLGFDQFLSCESRQVAQPPKLSKFARGAPKAGLWQDGRRFWNQVL